MSDDLVVMEQEWSACKPIIGSNGLMEDPSKWFLRITRLTERFKKKGGKEEHKKSPDGIKAFILANLPTDYSDVVTKYHGLLSKTSLTEIKTQISDKHKRLTQATSEGKNDNVLAVSHQDKGGDTVENRGTRRTNAIVGSASKGPVVAQAIMVTTRASMVAQKQESAIDASSQVI